LPTSKDLPSSLVQLRSTVWTGDTRDTRPQPDLNALRAPIPLIGTKTPLFTAKCQRSVRASNYAIAPAVAHNQFKVALHRSYSARSRRWRLLRRREHERQPCVPAVRSIGIVEFSRLRRALALRLWNSENSKANRIETMERSRGIWTNLFGGSKKNSEENSENSEK